ncbi:hypothetical protein F2Q70_00019580 [Brassica cretica]|uniref:Uncharacterized protein n=1 Tax=Brassica cretica TaxID=69181 RepID=A0A8S9GR16_BRACR|nr:hypothetical protein F2Q70_00019580 [Brassica cretica]
MLATGGVWVALSSVLVSVTMWIFLPKRRALALVADVVSELVMLSRRLRLCSSVVIWRIFLPKRRALALVADVVSELVMLSRRLRLCSSVVSCRLAPIGFSTHCFTVLLNRATGSLQRLDLSSVLEEGDWRGVWRVLVPTFRSRLLASVHGERLVFGAKGACTGGWGDFQKVVF